MSSTSAPRVIVPAQPRGSRVPSGWLRATVAGLEAATIAWLTVVVPAVATYIATAAAPALGEASWTTAASVGTVLWLLGHGASVAVGGTVPVTLVPLGVSLLTVLLSYGSTRRMRVDSYGAAAFVVVAYGVAVSLLGLVGGGADGVAVLVAAALAATGALPAARRSGAPTPAWVRRLTLPAWLAAGVRGAAWASVGLGVSAAGVVVLAVVRGVDQVRVLHEGLVADPVSAVALVLAQAAYLPTLTVWALAWLVGPGFAVGAGTQVSPALVTDAVVPGVPVLGALPEPGEPGLVWVVALPVAIGVAIAAHLHRRHRQPTLPRALLAVLTCSVLAAVAAAAATLAASGSIGPGSMTQLGASAPAVAAAVAAELLAGGALGAVVLHPSTRRRLGRLVAR